MTPNRKYLYWIIPILALLAMPFFINWHTDAIDESELFPTQHEFQNVLKNVQLGDGTRLGIETFVRWQVDSAALFYEQFDSLEQYAEDILFPRQSEWSNTLTFSLDKRDFRRKSIREQLKTDLQQLLFEKIGETNISILEVSILDIYKQKTLDELIAEMKRNQSAPTHNKTSKSSPTSTPQHLDELPSMQSSTIAMLTKVEELLHEKLIINSGHRDKEHNKRVGGVSNSAHLRGYAVDIATYSKQHRRKVVRALEQAGFKRIGVYPTHVHADNDPSLKNARW